MPYSSFLSISLSWFPLKHRLVFSFNLSFTPLLSVAATFVIDVTTTYFVDSADSIEKVFEYFGFGISMGIRTHKSINSDIDHKVQYFGCFNLNYMQLRSYASKPPLCLMHLISLLPQFDYSPEQS